MLQSPAKWGHSMKSGKKKLFILGTFILAACGGPSSHDQLMLAQYDGACQGRLGAVIEAAPVSGRLAGWGTNPPTPAQFALKDVPNQAETQQIAEYIAVYQSCSQNELMWLDKNAPKMAPIMRHRIDRDIEILGALAGGKYSYGTANSLLASASAQADAALKMAR